jgi:hypothetical protein
MLLTLFEQSVSSVGRGVGSANNNKTFMVGMQ